MGWVTQGQVLQGDLDWGGTGIGVGVELGGGAYGRLPASEVCKSAHICKVYPN